MYSSYDFFAAAVPLSRHGLTKQTYYIIHKNLPQALKPTALPPPVKFLSILPYAQKSQANGSFEPLACGKDAFFVALCNAAAFCGVLRRFAQGSYGGLGQVLSVFGVLP